MITDDANPVDDPVCPKCGARGKAAVRVYVHDPGLRLRPFFGGVRPVRVVRPSGEIVCDRCGRTSPF